MSLRVTGLEFDQPEVRGVVLADAVSVQLTYMILRGADDNEIARYTGGMWVTPEGQEYSDIVIEVDE